MRFEVSTALGNAGGGMLSRSAASNDNSHIAGKPGRESFKRESFTIEDFVSTRRLLKIQNKSLTEGSIGRILRVRSPGRLYDVGASAEAVVMTLSHCDIARCMQH